MNARRSRPNICMATTGQCFLGRQSVFSPRSPHGLRGKNPMDSDYFSFTRSMSAPTADSFCSIFS